MKPEALIKVRFLTADEGGRESAIRGASYGCPVMVDSRKGFDCRFVITDEAQFELGSSYEIPVKFLNPDLALRALREGVKICLWEGKVIAEGEIVKIF